MAFPSLDPPCNSMTLSFFGPGLIRAFASASRSAPSDSLSSSAAAISSDTARGDSVSGSLTIDDERRVRLLCILRSVDQGTEFLREATGGVDHPRAKPCG